MTTAPHSQPAGDEPHPDRKEIARFVWLAPHDQP
jgi:hypothetical protein